MALPVKPGASFLTPIVVPAPLHLSASSSSASLSSSSAAAVGTSRRLTVNSNQVSNTTFVVDWTNPVTLPLPNTTKTKDENLQDAFRRFRQQRMDEIRLCQRLESKKRKKIRRSNPQRMYRLRLKFLEQAKRYLGIPYAKKNFQPGTPEYDSKLFLDCCGLVRRVMYDLAKDFGFMLGPWNQSYMYDTLPKTITNLSDVQPGDLVFISAIYHNPKMKKQRHNLTHVEIMLGDGEKTIGSRWNDGKVQFFDSYKFVSKSYHSQVYTIKSLDPWLKGICQSCCSEHSWRQRRTKKVNKKSIFFSSDQPNGRRHRRSHDSNQSKRTSSSSLFSGTSPTKKTHRRRKRKRRTTRSRSHKRSSSAKSSLEKPTNQEQLPISSTLPIDSISEDDDNDDSIEVIENQLANMTCQGQDEQCDDSDSLDDAINAEECEDETDNNLITANIQ